MIESDTLSQSEAARFDFLQGLRLRNYEKHVASLVERYSTSDSCGTDQERERVGGLISNDVLYQFACGIQRHAQIMGWAEAGRVVEQHAEVFEEIFAEQDQCESDLLKLNDSLEIPDYYTVHDFNNRDDIHLNPGGYWGNALVGPVYELGGALYRTNWRNNHSDSRPGSLIAFAQDAPNDEYPRILDMGCSFGASAMAYRLAYPSADRVVGIDLSEAALRWAHQIAESRELEVVFEQRDALATGYEDGSFDLVTGFLLLHEVPSSKLVGLLQEVYRILDEGGHVRFMDIPPYSALSAERAFLQSFDAWGNGEAHWDGFLATDLKVLLKDVGFSEVRDGPLSFEEVEFKGNAALMRTSEFRPENRWVTCAEKTGS